MGYKITIEETKDVTILQQGAYVVVDRRPWTEKEINEASMSAYRERPLVEKEPLKEIRGYAPSREAVETKCVQIFQQVVATIDLGAVIKAINSL